MAMAVIPLHRMFPQERDGARDRVWADARWLRAAGADWTETIMQHELPDRFHAKQGRSIVRWELGQGADRLCVYLKRHYKLPGYLRWLKRLFPARVWSPGYQEFLHLQQAGKLGLPVPRVMAAAEFVGRDGNLQGCIAIEELTGQLALHEAIPLAEASLSAAEFNLWKDRLWQEIARLSDVLHRQCYFHKDWYLCHFYLPEGDCQHVPATMRGRLTVIDLHRLAHSRLFWWWYRGKDLAQLLYSMHQTGVMETDRQTIWQAHYPKRTLWNAGLHRLVRFKAGRYLRHHQRKLAKQANSQQ